MAVETFGISAPCDLGRWRAWDSCILSQAAKEANAGEARPDRVRLGWAEAGLLLPCQVLESWHCAPPNWWRNETKHRGMRIALYCLTFDVRGLPQAGPLDGGVRRLGSGMLHWLRCANSDFLPPNAESSDRGRTWVPAGPGCSMDRTRTCKTSPSLGWLVCRSSRS